MATKKSASTSLANVRDYYPALTDAQRAALREWNEYAEFVSTPFLPKEDAARKGVPFDIIRLGERTSTDLNDVAATIDQWVLLVRIRGDHAVSQRGGAQLEFKDGSAALVSLPKGDGLRDQTALVIRQILDKYGEMPGMTLRQLPPTKPGLSGPIVLHTDLAP